MKILVEYEKADMLRLVTDDLRRKGIKVKPGAMPEYKGALSVKLFIDAEEEEVAAVPEHPAESPQNGHGESEAPKPEAPPPRVDTTPVDMTDVLNASNRLVMTQPGKFEPKPKRKLEQSDRMQESEEYPGDE